MKEQEQKIMENTLQLESQEGAAIPTTLLSTTTATTTATTATTTTTTSQVIAKDTECDCVRVGKCKWFNVAKGWGFLTPNDGGQEVFVHQSVIQMSGFRSLGEQEEVEFECQRTARGLEATRVSGKQGDDCHGSTYRPRINRRTRRMRCYNCGEFANHIASECGLGPQPKRCHRCRSEDHLHADCPHRNVTQTSQRLSKSPHHIAEDEEDMVGASSSSTTTPTKSQS